MNQTGQIAVKLLTFLKENGWLITGTTVAGGLALGPEGILLGSTVGGAGATLRTVLASAAWRRMVVPLSAVLMSVASHLRMEDIRNFLNSVAELFVRLLRAGGMLPASEARLAIQYHPHQDRDEPEPKSGFSH